MIRNLAPLVLAAAITAGCAAQGGLGDATAQADGTLGPGRIPEGGMRFTRVTDPVTACTIITASTLGGVTLAPASTAEAGEQTTVTWRGSRVDNRIATVSCQVDRAAHQVTSVKVDGAERLTTPAPY